MNDVMRLLDSVLSDDIKLSKNPIIISEQNAGAKNTAVKFNTSSKTVVFSLEGHDHKKFFKDIKGLKKVNDGTIIVQKKDKILCY